MERLLAVLRYPKLTVRCFPEFGHRDILNHPQLLVQELKREIA